MDANVLSEATRPAPGANVLAWLARHERDLVVDPVILGELRVGILVLPAGRKRARLEAWLASLEGVLECVPWDAAVSRHWAALVAGLRKRGQAMPLVDSMIAATALAHGFAVASRNTRDFKRAGVKVVDPFSVQG